MKRYFIFLVAVVTIIFLLVWSFYKHNLRLNLTPSYPIGLYQLQSQTPHKGELVLICPPDNQKFHNNNFGFLASGDDCSTHTIPLIKKIVAVGGDTVVVGESVVINGREQPNSKVFKSHNYHKLTPCIGEHELGSGEVWVMSDYYEKSFDSRYFCGVSEKNIIGAIKPILVFGYNDK